MCIYHTRELLAAGKVGKEDPGPQAITSENTMPYGAPELPSGYIFSDWLRRAALANLCMAVRPF